MAFSDLGVYLGEISVRQTDRYTKDPMKHQKKLLKKIINKNKNCELGKKYGFSGIKTIDDFREKVPLTSYEDYDPYVERMIHKRENNLMYKGRNVRYCSSSGSVGKPKILPKSPEDIWLMQCVGFSGTVAVAARHLKKTQGKKLPKQMGPLVLVLTGHPLEDGKRCNGAGQVPMSYLKPITKFFCTSPVSLLYPEHEELIDSSYLQLRFCLGNRNVSYIGSIVITLVTTMFDYLEENWEMLCDDIEKGIINENVKITDDLRREYEKKLKPDPKRAAELREEFKKGFDTPIAPRIWPKLAWAYGMIGSNLQVYVAKLRKSIGDIPIHNMGYAAAEGFFAMPTELDVNDGVLLPQSVFFEFLPVDDDSDAADSDESVYENAKTLLLDELEVGKKYEIIVSNLSGLYRYKMEDVIRVTCMYNNTPRVELLYRKNLGMNIANEKTTTRMIDSAVSNISQSTGIEFTGHSFYNDFSSNPPRYCMLIEPKGSVSEEQRLELIKALDEQMKEINEKYFKYRRWGMINEPEVLIMENKTYHDYSEMLKNKGVVLNQIKPVTVINSKEREDFFLSHVITKESSAYKAWLEKQ